MHIFIDESGTFAGIGDVRSSVSVLGALVLPDGRLKKILSKYGRLRPSLPKRKGEVKGSLLSPAQVFSVIEILRRNEALFFAAMTDASLYTKEEVEQHRVSRIDALAANLADGHTPELRANIAHLQDRLRAFPAQLYMQMTLTVELLHRLLSEAIIYHSLRNPKELIKFHWIVDAKDKTIVTDWEDWWSKTIVIWLQAMSIHVRGRLLQEQDGVDYRFLERFFIPLPEYLAQQTGIVPQNDCRAGLDLQAIFKESFLFSPTPDPCLELVDIVTNVLRRALVGNIVEAGWLPLRSIMIHRAKNYIDALGMKPMIVTDRPYGKVLARFTEGGRSLGTKRLYSDTNNI